MIGRCHQRHRAVEFRKFLDTIEAEVPADLDVHLIADNYATHKTALIRNWLAKRPRFHMHFTPTSASWLNLVERWFGLLTEKQLRRGVHQSSAELEAAIYRYLDVTNEDPKPFVWTQTANQILANVARFCQRTLDTGHYRKGSLLALLTFAFCLGFGATVAEPALIAIADEAARVASEAEAIANSEAARSSYAFNLRMVVAFSVGGAVLLGVLRILKGWPIHRLIIGGYVLVTLMTLMAPPEIVGIAYDSGGVTTSTMTVPLVTALGVGLATTIRGRNPLVDGFGIIALASLTPMACVMAYGMFA